MSASEFDMLLEVKVGKVDRPEELNLTMFVSNCEVGGEFELIKGHLRELGEGRTDLGVGRDGLRKEGKWKGRSDGLGVNGGFWGGLGV